LELWLKERKPNIVGLQELKIQNEDFPFEFFKDLGYESFVHGQKSWNGVAILSNVPGELKLKGLEDQEDFGARLITAKFGELEFTTCYCPNGKDINHQDYAAKLGWFESLIGLYQKNSSEKSILCGDFNIVPTEVDSWMGEKAEGTIFHTIAEREKMSRLLETGFIDLYRQANPDLQAFTWWDYRGGSFHRKHGLRIDFILGSNKVSKDTTEITIDRDFRKKKGELTASDHAPVFADLDWQ